MRYFVLTLISNQLSDKLILFVGWVAFRQNLRPRVGRERVPKGSPAFEFDRLNIA